MQIDTPPTKGMAPLCNLREFGLSTNPIFFANLRMVKVVAREKKNRKKRSINEVSTIQPNNVFKSILVYLTSS